MESKIDNIMKELQQNNAPNYSIIIDKLLQQLHELKQTTSNIEKIDEKEISYYQKKEFIVENYLRWKMQDVLDFNMIGELFNDDEYKSIICNNEFFVSKLINWYKNEVDNLDDNHKTIFNNFMHQGQLKSYFLFYNYLVFYIERADYSLIKRLIENNPMYRLTTSDLYKIIIQMHEIDVIDMCEYFEYDIADSDIHLYFNDIITFIRNNNDGDIFIFHNNSPLSLLFTSGCCC